jgi:NAD(P)-dependent dehydrogenase (short-subunit alcohol dehydrogenase family)
VQTLFSFAPAWKTQNVDLPWPPVFGGRYLSAEASARGEWKPGGSGLPGRDAYATSKQCNLATVLAFARESPRLRFNAFEPGFIPNTGLGRQGNAFLRFLLKYILPLLAPHKKYWSNPQRAGREATKILINASGRTGVYYDDGGGADARLGADAGSKVYGACCW